MQYRIVSSPWVQKALPYALTAATGAGVIGTAVLAAKATPKAIEKRDLAEKEKGEPLTTWEKFKAMAPSYIPAASTGALTLAGIGGMALLNHKQEAKIAGLIASGNQIISQVTRKYNALREDVKEKDPKILRDFDQRTLDDEWNDYIRKRTKKEAYCWPACFPNIRSAEFGQKRMFGIEYGNGLADENGHEIIFFEATPGDVITAFYNLNGTLQEEGMVSLNHLFYFLHQPKTDLGEKLVWDVCVLSEEWGRCFIDFNTEDLPLEDDGMVPEPAECTLITFHIPPLAEGYADGMNYPSLLYPAE